MPVGPRQSAAVVGGLVGAGGGIGRGVGGGAAAAAAPGPSASSALPPALVATGSVTTAWGRGQAPAAGTGVAGQQQQPAVGRMLNSEVLPVSPLEVCMEEGLWACEGLGDCPHRVLSET